MQRIGIALLVAAAIAAGVFVANKNAEHTSPEHSQTKAGSIELAALDSAAADGSAVSQAFPSLSAGPKSLADWHGKTRLVNFWASWCVPCIREIPLLKSLQASTDELQIIGIAMESEDEAAAYARETEFNYPILIGEQGGTELAEAMGIDFLALPLTLLLAPDGELVFAHLGEFKQSDLDHIQPVFAALNEGSLSAAQAREQLSK